MVLYTALSTWYSTQYCMADTVQLFTVYDWLTTIHSKFSGSKGQAVYGWLTTTQNCTIPMYQCTGQYSIFWIEGQPVYHTQCMAVYGKVPIYCVIQCVWLTCGKTWARSWCLFWREVVIEKTGDGETFLSFSCFLQQGDTVSIFIFFHIFLGRCS